MNFEIRELTFAELDRVAGGEVKNSFNSNYKFCWDGPAGTGSYPWYIKCNDGVGSSYGWDDLGKDIGGAAAGGGGRPA